MLPQKYQRNPLKAEKSPRVRNTGFDFSIPAKQCPDQERWIYPDTDRGLVSKLPSQKVIYQQVKDKEKAHMENVRQLAAQQAAIFDKKQLFAAAAAAAAAEEAAANAANNPTLQDVSTKYDGAFEDYNYDYEAKYKQEKKTETDKKKFYKQPISTFKSLGASNPEVLADWRANRAAAYVAKIRNPLEPPAPSDLGPTPFRPPGATGNKTAKAHNNPAKPLTVDALEQQLKETQNAIDRQKNKLGKMRK
jgi:hypothetical protein